jgi:hypothetical protein
MIKVERLWQTQTAVLLTQLLQPLDQQYKAEQPQEDRQQVPVME